MENEIIHYQDPQSRAMRTQMLLDVFDIPHKKVLVEIQKKDHHKPEYLKIHPYHRVPALQHGDITVVESGAITLYLADLFPDKFNTPAVGTPDRVRLYEWLFFINSTLEPCAMEFFMARDDAGKDKARKKIRELLEAMQTRFVGPFVLGEQFSLLDIVLVTELFWYKIIDAYPKGLEVYDNFMKANASRLPAPQPQPQ